MFYQNKNYQKKKKKLYQTNNCFSFFSIEQEIILSLFLYKYLQNYYVYLQTLYKFL